MAIQFVNNLDINQNYLEQAAIENLAADPASGVLGQLIFNTNSGELKVCTTAGNPTGAVYSAVGGGVESITTANSTFVNLADSGTASVPILTASLSASGTPDATKYLRGDNAWEAISAIPGTYDWDLQTDSGAGAKVTVGSGDTVVFTSGNSTLDVTNSGLSTSINLPTTGVTAASYTYTALTVDAYGRITAASSGTSPVTSITGGTDITITGTAAVPIINQTAITRLDTVSTASPAAGATFTAVDSVTSSTTGNITALNLKTITLPADTNDNTTYTLPVTNGDNPDIVLTGFNPSSTDIININGTSTTVKVTGSGTNTLGFDLVDDVTIVNDLTIGGELTVSGTGQSSFGGQVTIPTTPSAGTDAASKSYVDSLVAGGLTFKDGFNAGTGALDGGGNLTTGGTRVALEVGDFYVVTTAGSFYGSVTLDVGDSVIAKLAAAAGTSDINDWVIVQGDEGVTTFSNSNGGTYVAYGSTNSGAIGPVDIGDVDLTAVDGTSDTSTRFLSKDNTWDVPSYTTNTDAKYALTAAAKSGSNVPLTLTGSDGGATTVVNLTEGSNITLTRNSSGQVTIASTDTGALGDRVALTGGSTAGGLTTFAYTVTSSFAGAVALDVKCEVITAAGQTVYADVTRSGTTLSVIFTGTVADSAYEALLTYVG